MSVIGGETVMKKKNDQNERRVDIDFLNINNIIFRSIFITEKFSKRNTATSSVRGTP
jgi:hypothetical protein